jgi:predicted dehydrogenase
MSNRSFPRVTRRRFVQAAGAVLVGAPAFVSCRAPSEKLNVVVIGCGGRGGSNLNEMLGENVVALCDVNDAALAAAGKKAPQARQFRDFRKLYDSLKDSDFDAVVVSSTEHTHAFATMPALKRKKHVYCEKPLTYNQHEARLITEAAKQAGVATQMGTQIHATDNYRRVVELIQSGAIGPVSEAHVWVGRAWGRQSKEDARKHHDIVWSDERPKEAQPIPKGLDWDLWIGPAPKRPFNNIYVPGPRWYRWWDFGGGTMSDLGAHWLDLPFWALKLDAPTTVEAGGPPPHAEIAPASMSATFSYAARGNRPAVAVSWYQGTMRPALWTQKKIPQWGSGALFVGSKGMLLADYGKHLLLPEKDFADFKRPPKTIPSSVGHHAEWLRACKTGSATTCPFSYSGLLTEANHLGNVAYRAGKKLEWDTKSMRIKNAPEAERFLSREYRKGWSLA